MIELDTKNLTGNFKNNNIKYFYAPFPRNDFRNNMFIARIKRHGVKWKTKNYKTSAYVKQVTIFPSDLYPDLDFLEIELKNIKEVEL